MGDVVRARSPSGKGANNPFKSPGAIVGIAVAFLAVIAFGAYLGFKSARDRSEDREVDDVPPEEEQPPVELVYAFQVLEGRDIAPVLETDAKAVAGRRHVRVTREKGKVKLVEHIGPAGNVASRWSVTHVEDGGREVRIQSSRGILVETRELSADGVETRLQRIGSRLVRGCAKVKWELDDAGVPTRSSCLDAAGRPAIDLDGCEVVREEHDEHKLLTSSSCFSAVGEARLDATFVHRTRYQRDARGNAVKESFFDVNDEPAPNDDGCTELAFTFDDAGNSTSRTCLRAGQPTNVTGSSRVVDRYEYDSRGCLLRESPIDASGNVVLGDDTHVTRYGRDEHCGEISSASTDEKGNLVAVPGEPARSQNVIGGEGDLAEWRCFGLDDRPADCFPSSNGKTSGASVIRYSYDERGRMLSRRGFDADGNPRRLTPDLPHEERSIYDDRGLATEEAYFDASGKPGLAFETVARTVNRYDEAGQLVSFAGFGVDGRPVTDSTMIHELKISFDAAHRRSGIVVYDTKGAQPRVTSLVFDGVEWPDSGSRLEIVREKGFVIENVFFDRDDRLVSRIDCRSRDVVCTR